MTRPVGDVTFLELDCDHSTSYRPLGAAGL